MAVKISYFIIFGIITITTGIPARDDSEDSHYSYVNNEYELQKLLQSLANQGTYDAASNHREERPNAYRENRAGSSRYDEKPSQLYYHGGKADSPQYYESQENVDENQPSISSLQIIKQLLKNNENKAEYDNEQNIMEDLVSLNRNNKYKSLKPNDETDNVDEVVAFLSDLQRKVADDRNNRDDYVYGKARGDNLKGKLYHGEIDKQEVSDQVKSVLAQPKQNGVMKLVENIVGYKSRYNEPDYVPVIDSYDRDNLRCNGKNCARNNNAVNDDNNNRLRCRGNNCARTRNDDDVIKSKLSAQKVKLNDELDAVVLGLSDVDHLLTKLNLPKQTRKNKLRGAKLLENVDLDKLLNKKSSIGNKGNVEAVVFDLTQVENGDAVARQIKRLLSQNTEGSYDEYEEYGNLVEEHLKQGVYDIGQKVGTGRANAKILPHNENNNNVYLPQWLLDEVIARSYAEKESAKGRAKERSSFPLTRQQKERNQAKKKQNTPRIYRRNIEQDVGVPFHLEVQGLGQVNP